MSRKWNKTLAEKLQETAYYHFRATHFSLSCFTFKTFHYNPEKYWSFATATCNLQKCWFQAKTAKWRLVPETSRCFHYWQPAPSSRLLPWLANPGNPAMSPQAKLEDIWAGKALLREKGAHGLGSQSPKEKCPNLTAPRKTAQMKGKGGHNCYASCPATERMVSIGVCTYSK